MIWWIGCVFIAYVHCQCEVQTNQSQCALESGCGAGESCKWSAMLNMCHCALASACTSGPCCDIKTGTFQPRTLAIAISQRNCSSSFFFFFLRHVQLFNCRCFALSDRRILYRRFEFLSFQCCTGRHDLSTRSGCMRHGRGLHVWSMSSRSYEFFELCVSTQCVRM